MREQLLISFVQGSKSDYNPPIFNQCEQNFFEGTTLLDCSQGKRLVEADEIISCPLQLPNNVIKL